MDTVEHIGFSSIWLSHLDVVCIEAVQAYLLETQAMPIDPIKGKMAEDTKEKLGRVPRKPEPAVCSTSLNWFSRSLFPRCFFQWSVFPFPKQRHRRPLTIPQLLLDAMASPCSSPKTPVTQTTRFLGFISPNWIFHLRNKSVCSKQPVQGPRYDRFHDSDVRHSRQPRLRRSVHSSPPSRYASAVVALKST